MRPLSSLEGSIKPIFEVVLLFLLAPAVISRQTPNISDLSSPSAPSLPSSEGECEKSGLASSLREGVDLTRVPKYGHLPLGECVLGGKPNCDEPYA